MSEPDPRRFVDEGGELGDALSELRVRDFSTYDAERGLSAFESARAEFGASPGSSGSASSSSTPFIVAGVLAAAVGAGLWWFGSGLEPGGNDHHEPAAPTIAAAPTQNAEPVDRARTPESIPAASPEPDSREVAPPEAEAQPDPVAPKTGETAPRPKGPSKKKATPPTPAEQADETRLTSDMRRALARDPAKALELAERGDREFPRGMFGRERMAYAVLALAALGRDAEANKRAKAFLDRYPSGPLSEQIREVLGLPAP